jgi:HEAT repeat protein
MPKQNLDVTRLINEIKSGDYEQRTQAAEELRRCCDAEAIPTLTKALHEADFSVGYHLAKVLGGLGDPALPALLRALQHPRSEVRESAVVGLEENGSPAVASALIGAAISAKGYVRLWAVVALGKMRATMAVPALIVLLKDTTNRDRLIASAAAEALGKIGDPVAVPALISALKTRRAGVRSAAVMALGKLGDPAAVPALIAALKHKAIREHAAHALGKLGDVSAVPALCGLLKTGRVTERMTAALALGKLGDTAAVPALQNALEDPDASVRRDAEYALEQIERQGQK